MDPEGWCAVEAGESGRPATTTLSWSNRKMTAARSRGRVASTCVAVSVPARKAATNAGSRIGATAVMVRINTEDHQLRPETVQKTEGLQRTEIQELIPHVVNELEQLRRRERELTSR